MADKKNNPAVSVIIPTYNRGWILKEAIDSVLAQEGVDLELIVVDDGSTDDTADILDSYGDQIRVIGRPANDGVSAARNQGVAASTGALIAFLDSDDWWLKGKLSIQADFFHTHPDALICQTDELWVRNGVRVNPKKYHKKPSGMIFELSLSRCLVSPSAVMMRRSLFDTVGGFDERFRICEDYDLWLRISCEHPIYLIDTPLIVKRGGHPDQISKDVGLDKLRIRSITQMMESKVLSPDQYAAAVRILKEKCRIYASGCRKRGRQDEARHYEELAGRYD
ncbi:MAG: glycosyltransferase [Desulfobacterales bacterium]